MSTECKLYFVLSFEILITPFALSKSFLCGHCGDILHAILETVALRKPCHVPQVRGYCGFCHFCGVAYSLPTPQQNNRKPDQPRCQLSQSDLISL
jgi:hypothetical protein